MLSNTYHPSPALAPYIRRFYIFDAELPDDYVIDDFQLAETAFVRCMIAGDWRGGVASDELSQTGRALFFGANNRPFHVRVKGSFKLAGFSIRPGGWHSLFAQSHDHYADDLMPLAEIWGAAAKTMFNDVENAASEAEKVAAMEAAIAEQIEQVGKPAIDEAMAQFESIARTDSTMRIDDAASQIGLSVRQLERRCKATFGLTPKAVLRRSRFLDMAAAMRGFSSPSDADLAELRYFDQSHLNREFKHFTGLTPGQFGKTETPFLTAGLKLREESLYEN